MFGILRLFRKTHCGVSPLSGLHISYMSLDRSSSDLSEGHTEICSFVVYDNLNVCPVMCKVFLVFENTNLIGCHCYEFGLWEDIILLRRPG